MKNYFNGFGEDMKPAFKLTNNILESITEHSEEIEKALINSIFLSIKSNREEEIPSEEMDSLHLLWHILQDAKEFKKLRRAHNIMYQTTQS